MKFHVLTLFSEMIEQGLGTSVIGKAMQRGAISLNVVKYQRLYGRKAWKSG